MFQISETFNFGVVDPETKEVEDTRSNWKPVWHVVNYNNNKIYGADRPIVGAHVNELLTEIYNEAGNKKIYVLTGSHGDRLGKNWCKTSNSRDPSNRFYAKRCKEIIERCFLYDDRRFVERMERVEVINLDNVSVREFETYLEGERHVVLAYCYSRNDAALRNLFKIGPVTSTYFRK